MLQTSGVRGWEHSRTLCPVTVQPRKQVHAEVGEHDGGKADDGEDGCFFAAPAADESHVDKGGVDEPGDEGPGLLGVPAPVAAPGGVGPYRAGDDADGEKEKTQKDHLVGGLVDVEGGVLGLLRAWAEKVEKAQGKGEGKGGIAHKTGHDVGAEPVALQGGHQGADLGAHIGGERGVGQGQKREGQGKAPCDADVHEPFQHQVKGGDGQAVEDKGFIEIGQWDTPDAQGVGFGPPQQESRRIDPQAYGRRGRGRQVQFVCLENPRTEVEKGGQSVDKG